MAELDPKTVAFHEIKPTGTTPEQRLASIGVHFTDLAVRCQNRGRLLVWPPLEVKGPNGDTAGYIVPSVPAGQGPQ